MSYAQSFDTCPAAALGEHGLNEVEPTAAPEQRRGGLAQLRAWRDDGALPLLALSGRRDDLAALEPVIARYREHCSDLVVLGSGGSSLGGRALYALADPGKGPRVHFLENTDAWSFDAAFKGLNLAATGVIAIAKPGGASETMMQFANTLSYYRETLDDAAVTRLFTAITEPGDTPLRRLAGCFAIPCLDHDPEFGGRFSALSLVGLLPAAIAGADIAAVRRGAAQVLAAALAAGDPSHSVPAPGAPVSAALAANRRSMRLDAVDEYSLGALMMHFMLETIISEHMIEADSLDQSAADVGKVRARR